jgi:hypothetical protein
LTVERLAIDVNAVGRPDGDGFRASINNTNSVGSLLLGGTIIDTGKLVIDAKVVPYKDGVIVDATMRVKARKFEDQVAPLTGSIENIYTWLALPGG